MNVHENFGMHSFGQGTTDYILRLIDIWIKKVVTG